MDLPSLLARLRTAYAAKSLRKLAVDCNVSHELLRKLIASKDQNPNITKTTFDKIDAGLCKNDI